MYSITAFNHDNIHLEKSFDIRSATEIYKLLLYLMQLKVCPGNYDDKFQPLVKQKKGHFTDKQGKKSIMLKNNYQLWPNIRKRGLWR